MYVKTTKEQKENGLGSYMYVGKDRVMHKTRGGYGGGYTVRLCFDEEGKFIVSKTQVVNEEMVKILGVTDIKIGVSAEDELHAWVTVAVISAGDSSIEDRVAGYQQGGIHVVFPEQDGYIAVATGTEFYSHDKEYLPEVIAYSMNEVDADSVLTINIKVPILNIECWHATPKDTYGVEPVTE